VPEDLESFGHELEVAHLERNELGATKAASETKEQQRAATRAQQARWNDVHHPPQLRCSQRILLGFRDAEPTSSAFPRFLHEAVGAWRDVPGHQMRLRDGRQRQLQRRDLARLVRTRAARYSATVCGAA